MLNIKKDIGFLKNYLLRKRCVLCQVYHAPTTQPLCQGCCDDLPWRGETLIVQGLSVEVAFAYQWPIDRLIHLYKYQAHLELIPVFEYGLRQIERPMVDAILAVPVSHQRLRDRGFNQSHELAKRMADYWNLPLLTDVNRRDGLRQKDLSRSERIQNLESAFGFESNVAIKLPRRIVLIDDVLTTGSTLLSLVDFLREHGVEELSAVVVASEHQSSSDKTTNASSDKSVVSTKTSTTGRI